MPNTPRPPVGPATGWTISGHSATATAAKLDLHQPGHGLTTSRGERLLGLDLTCRGAADKTLLGPSEYWARGSDLTAIYEPADWRHLRTTAMWREMKPHGADSAWELIASAQTSLLHSDPQLTVNSDIAGDEILCGGWPASPALPGIIFTPGTGGECRALLVRSACAPTVLVVVHPREQRQQPPPIGKTASQPVLTAARHGGRISISCELFPCGVEKGVLLRARVLAAVGPFQGDIEWATRLAEVFAASPPELAT